MSEQRFAELARNIVDYSLDLQPGENLLIEVTGREEIFTKELVRAAYARGARPFLSLRSTALQREWLLGVTEEQLGLQAAWESARMEEMQAYVGLRVKENAFELAGVPKERMRDYNVLLQEPVHGKIRVPKTKWVVLRYPNESMAQEARMSTGDFADFYFAACNLDYRKMSLAMDPLVELLERTKEVHIKAPGTDLRFSVEGIGAVKCDGHRNIPDGEVYTAPRKDSAEGFITYNTPSVWQGKIFYNVRLRFERGQIVEAVCDNDSEGLNAVFQTDAGARYVGEFAFGLHPNILHPINDILFDEKIAGSIHFTPGSCYESADNGNKSAIHWDLVTIQRPEYGGGEIYFDGQLVRKDGLFVMRELEGLNPQNLLRR
ncbi:MAG: aminopeptidase [Clostridiales bacterium]|nr:aminopeptidase [Clostridiales bacterium]